MCGYCFEGSMMETWLNTNFSPENAEAVFQTTQYFSAHLVPEFVTSKDYGLTYIKHKSHHCYLIPWLLYKKSLHEELSTRETDWGLALLNQHCEKLNTLPETSFVLNFPALCLFLRSFDFNTSFNINVHEKNLLVAEAEQYIQTISSDFKFYIDEPLPKKEPPQAQGMFSKMLPILEEIPLHDAFDSHPLFLYFATELLIRFKPKSDMLMKPILVRYPVPSFDSYMMAWQRYLASYLVTQQDLALQQDNLLQIRLSLLFYLGLRFSHETSILNQLINTIEINDASDDILSKEYALAHLRALL